MQTFSQSDFLYRTVASHCRREIPNHKCEENSIVVFVGTPREMKLEFFNNTVMVNGSHMSTFSQVQAFLDLNR